jgi:hypothetical protein
VSSFFFLSIYLSVCKGDNVVIGLDCDTQLSVVGSKKKGKNSLLNPFFYFARNFCTVWPENFSI